MILDLIRESQLPEVKALDRWALLGAEKAACRTVRWTMVYPNPSVLCAQHLYDRVREQVGK